MKIAVIGAGSAGLAALRHSTLDIYKNEVICYERTDQVGGTWVYREESGVDQYGLPIHTSMYKSLRTNLPKELMGFPDYPLPDAPESFIHRTEILDFLNSYCDHFKLRQYIRFLHNVELVKLVDKNHKWSIRVKDLQKNIVTVEMFDAVMVCNGHFSNPNIPEIKGQDIFKGQQMHSHDYRVPEVFKDKTVVVFGAGPSGFDLVLEIAKTAKKIFFSHHIHGTTSIAFPDNIIQKPDVEELTEHSVLFKDGSNELVDAIFYCTGYKYGFSFLDETCGVHVDSNMVTPLWKHVVSIENPTLALIGLLTHVCAFNMWDLQVRFVLQFWSGKKNFPSKEEMLKDQNEELRNLTIKGTPKNHFHVLNDKQDSYQKDLARIADIQTLPPVIMSLYDECFAQFFDNLIEYRNTKYKLIDDHHFVKLV
ncbi:Senecionine N-oxygenase [Anthophora quadrimaculata]